MFEENARLKRLDAELSLDKAMLQDAVSKVLLLQIFCFKVSAAGVKDSVAEALGLTIYAKDRDSDSCGCRVLTLLVGASSRSCGRLGVARSVEASWTF